MASCMACKLQKKGKGKSPSKPSHTYGCSPVTVGEVREAMMNACPNRSEKDSQAVTSDRTAVPRGACALVVGSSSAGDVAQVRQARSAASAKNKNPRIQEDGVCYRRTCHGKLCRHQKSPVISGYIPHKDATTDAFESRLHKCPLASGLTQASGSDGSMSSDTTAAKVSSKTSIASLDIRTMVGMGINADDVSSLDTPTSLATPQSTSEDILTTQSYDLGACSEQPSGKGGTTLQACTQDSPGLDSDEVRRAQITAVQGRKILAGAPATPEGGTALLAEPSGSKRTLADYGFRVTMTV